MALAEEARDRVDLPVLGVGPGREVRRGSGRARPALLLGDRGLQRVELPAQPSGLGARFPQGVLGARAAHVDQRADARRGDADHRRREAEHGLVGDHRGDADHDRDQRERGAQHHAAIVRPLLGCRRHPAVTAVSSAVTRSASSATMSLTRKSFGV